MGYSVAPIDYVTRTDLGSSRPECRRRGVRG
jgi:hypothetical protein